MADPECNSAPRLLRSTATHRAPCLPLRTAVVLEMASSSRFTAPVSGSVLNMSHYPMKPSSPSDEEEGRRDFSPEIGLQIPELSWQKPCDRPPEQHYAARR